jgi:hypothetical protein
MSTRWYAILDRLPQGEITGVELGVWHGGLSERLLKARSNLFLHLVDRWQKPTADDSYATSGAKIAGMDQQEYTDALKHTLKRLAPYHDRYTAHIKDTAEFANYIRDRSMDFVFIDADHSFAGVMRDITAWYPKVKPGGWIGGHDYDHPEQGEVKRAVHEYFKDCLERLELSYSMTWFVRVE